jgi:aryl-alcohol dehydrogenase-like predicted oxidoreductase
MRRRDFLMAGACTVAAPLAHGAASRRASDTIALGPDRVALSRVAMGTGTKGYSKSSNQTRQLGLDGLAGLLRFGFDQGFTFWDSADGYGSHPHLKEALKNVPREKVAIMTKTRARTAAEMRADLDRFRREIGTDYLDIVLLHALTDADWPRECAGAMDVLADAREKKIVRTHGCSCHSLEALKTAARTPWVHVDLARINPAGLLMDAEPAAVIGVLRQMKAAGKGVIGMKILGEGQLRGRAQESVRFVLGLDCVDCFTIGFESRDELTDLARKVAAA